MSNAQVKTVSWGTAEYVISDVIAERELTPSNNTRHSAPAQYSPRTVALLAASLMLLQILDGVLTSIGIDRFGLDVEGNSFLRGMMEQFGHVPTLAVAKFFAIALIASLALTANRVRWIPKAMGALTCLYLFAAILPWTYLLFICR